MEAEPGVEPLAARQDAADADPTYVVGSSRELPQPHEAEHLYYIVLYCESSTESL